MILVDVKQGSDEWLCARLGIPTASQFHRIVTPTGKPSSAAAGYALELIAERMIGEPLGGASTGMMARGSDLESEAVAYYELMRGAETAPGGFVTDDLGRWGASPDRLIGDDGLLEIKCPSPAVHVGYILGYEAEKYRPQVQGQLFVTGRAWCDWMSYHPTMRPAIIRHERDDAFIDALQGALERFSAQLADFTARVNQRG